MKSLNKDIQTAKVLKRKCAGHVVRIKSNSWAKNQPHRHQETEKDFED